MRRLGWLLRCAFHDWMWEADTDLGRRLARRLPRYFSDPHMPSKREVERLLADESAWTQAAGPRMILQAPPQTWAAVSTFSITKSF